MRALAALSYRDYRLLWTTSISAGAAAWALIVARGWLVYDLSESNLSVGLVTFTAMIPRALVTPFTGYLSDRFDRRRVIASMFAVNVAHNLVLALLVMTGYAEVWHIIVLSFVNGSARAAGMPASQALTPNLVPRRLLLNAIALGQAANHGSRLLGPAAIAPLMAFAGAEAAFFLCTGFYVVGLVQTLRIGTASTGRIDRRQNFFGNLVAGLVYVYRTPNLRAIVFLAMFHCSLTMSFESLLPELSRQRLGAEGAGFSYLMMAIGGGALVSAVFLAGVRSEATKGRLFLVLGLMSGMLPVALGLVGNLPLALLATAVMGGSQAGFMTLTHTMIQSITPDAIRGRVAAVYSVHIGGMMASANLVNGGVAEWIDAPLVLMAGGAAFVVVMLASWRGATLRRIYVRGLRAEPAPAEV